VRLYKKDSKKNVAACFYNQRRLQNNYINHP
jgi:hypothetical protein